MAVDRWLADLLDVRGLPLMSAGILLVICCAMRFQAIAIGALDSGLGRIPPRWNRRLVCWVRMVRGRLHGSIFPCCVQR